ncbi:MAG: molecular chaperone TorD family protein [Nitrospinota bacterium]|nr:molecular chaperone TorD family protein [Nitrospinota bacterium]
MSIALLDPPEIKLLKFLNENYSFLFRENDIPLEDLIKNLRTDFTNLFVLSSPPYESVLLDESGFLNSKITDNVNDFFRHTGFNPGAKNVGQKFHSVMSMDHISVELEFMSHLAKNQHNSLTDENENEYYKWLNLSSKFLDNHLLKWAPIYLTAIERDSKTFFYKELCTWTQDFILEDRKYIEDISKRN